MRNHYVGNLFTQQDIDDRYNWINSIDDWWAEIDSMQKILIFNDAQIRNLAIKNPKTNPHLCLFDWECTSIQLPQRDLVEILS